MAPYIALEEGARVGVWGKTTATLDWCEENYALSNYIAEFCEQPLFIFTLYSYRIAGNFRWVLFSRFRYCLDFRGLIFRKNEPTKI